MRIDISKRTFDEKDLAGAVRELEEKERIYFGEELGAGRKSWLGEPVFPNTRNL